MKRFVCAIILLTATSVFAATIESISIRREKEFCNIIFRGKGKLDYTSAFLNDPPRIVLDFPGTDSSFTGKTLEGGDNSFVQQIRTAERLSPGRKDFRVIIDLKTYVDLSVSPTGDGFAFRLTARRTPWGQTSENPKRPDAVQNLRPTERGDYLVEIGPEDLLEVTVFELPQFNVTSRVSGDGTITMPLIGSVRVTGLTKDQAEQKLETELEAKYINSANVSINIKEYKSKQIAVLGAVAKPGPYYILSNRSLLQVITDAGGLTPEVGPKCFIFRFDGSKIEIDLADLMIAGNQQWNVDIYPGDVINIPPATKSVVYVLGEVKTPGPVELPFGSQLTLLTAIARAGGLTSNAKSEILVRRKTKRGQIEVLKVNLKDILKGKEPDMQLQTEDVINVPESFF